jgi:hypothetical protein
MAAPAPLAEKVAIFGKEIVDDVFAWRSYTKIKLGVSRFSID